MSVFWSGYRQPADTTGSAYVAADQAAAVARQAEERARDSNERLDQLRLVCAAMWELLRERTNLTDDDLVTRVAEIDARDGTADGKITQSPKKCPGCQRTLLGKHRRCLYCGAAVPLDLFSGI